MPIRSQQVLFDEGIDLDGSELQAAGRISFEALANGTLPLINQLLFADNRVKAHSFLVTSRFDVGSDNGALMVQRAATVSLHNRNSLIAYDGQNRILTDQERDGVSAVKTSTMTYDGQGRIATRAEATSAGTVTATYGYDGTSERILTETRVVT